MGENRWNVDQVPLPFICNQDKTYAEVGDGPVWIRQPGSGLDNRQATLRLCIRPSSEQTVKPAIVFNGLSNISPLERSQYDKRVNVYFQHHAWMDIAINMQWTKQTFLPGLKDKSHESVLFCDNVNFQTLKEFYELCKSEGNTVVYLLPNDQTDKVQPIDQG